MIFINGNIRILLLWVTVQYVGQLSFTCLRKQSGAKKSLHQDLSFFPCNALPDLFPEYHVIEQLL